MLDIHDTAEIAAPPLASRGQRLAGALIDLVLQAACTWPLLTWLHVGPALWDSHGNDALEKLRSAALGWLVFLVLHGWRLHTHGQTLGKWIVGTRIVDLEGKVPPLARLFVLRVVILGALGALLPNAFLPLFLIDALLIFRADRRCAHDWLAGTRVVNP